MIYIIDTFAWIEYFNGSDNGLLLKKLLSNINNKLITLECCMSELFGYCLRNNLDFDKVQSIVKRDSVILPVLIDQWLNAARIRFETRKKINNFGLIDSILLAKQSELKCLIVTGDPHFKGMKNVVFLSQKVKV